MCRTAYGASVGKEVCNGKDNYFERVRNAKRNWRSCQMRCCAGEICDKQRVEAAEVGDAEDFWYEK